MPSFVVLLVDEGFMKDYRINYPKGERQVVRLLPGQKLIITTERKNRVHVTGQFLKVTHSPDRGGDPVYTIVPTEDIVPFSHLSTHYLGEVLIGIKFSILVYLEGNNDRTPELCRKVITLVNPMQDSMRIRPYEIIEFIYCSEYDRDIAWVWDKNKTVLQDSGIELDEIGYGISYSQYDRALNKSIEFCSPNSRNLFSAGVQIHHFWFRLGAGLLIALSVNPKKDVYLGKLIIQGNSEKGNFDECSVDVYCDLLPKYRLKTLDTSMISRPVASHACSKFPRIFDIVISKFSTKSMEAGCKIVDTTPVIAQCPNPRES